MNTGYFIIISDDKITSRGFGPIVLDEQKEVTKKIYDQLTRLPADFETDSEGNIISVTPAPEPEPEPEPQEPTYQKPLTEEIADIKQSIAELTIILGGGV